MGVLARHKEEQADACGKGRFGQRTRALTRRAMAFDPVFDAVSVSFMSFASRVNQTSAGFGVRSCRH